MRILAVFTVLLSAMPVHARSAERKALSLVKGALDDVQEANRSCRRAVQKDLQDLKEDLDDAGLSQRKLKKIMKSLRAVREDASDACPRSVGEYLKKAGRALDDDGDDDDGEGDDDDDNDDDDDDDDDDGGESAAKVVCWNASDPGCGNTRDGHGPMQDSVFQSLLNALHAERNSLLKEDIAKTSFKTNYLTVMQLGKVISTVRNELIKESMVKAAAGRVVDPEHAGNIRSHFRNSLVGSGAYRVLSQQNGAQQAVSGSKGRRSASEDLVCFYAKPKYRGKSYCAPIGIRTANARKVIIDGKKRDWQRKIRSVAIYGNAKLTAYRKKAYGGIPILIHRSESELRKVDTTEGRQNWAQAIVSYRTH